MAYIEIEINNYELPESFNYELYIHKKGGEITCACIDTDTRFESAVDGHYSLEVNAWETLLDLIITNIIEVLEKRLK